MEELTEKKISECSLTACTTHIQWLIDQVHLDNGELTIDGWAIAQSGSANKARFILNDKDFEDVNYPIPSPALGEIFWNTPAAQNARFVCKSAINKNDTFRDGFACFRFLPDGRETTAAFQRAWYYPDPTQNALLPDDKRIWRVIGVEAPTNKDLTSYLIGGASTFKRFEQYLARNHSKQYADFPRILDWGCGCGRVSRHFSLVRNSQLWGADIDADNIAWCKENLPHANFSSIPLLPPTEFQDQFFDLVIGISVLTHLSEEHQFLWLQELKRITRKDALLLLSVQGLPQLGLYRTPPDIIRRIEEEGFVITGRNEALDTVIIDHTYYINVTQSRKYIYNNWSKYFTVLEIVDAIAANQDLVILRNDK